MSDYKELTTPEEIANAVKYCDAWKDPSIPTSQYDIAVKHEMEKNIEDVPPFKAFKDALGCLHFDANEEKHVLEVGASSGYYGEILRRLGYKWDYTALDYNPEFKVLSDKLFPANKFMVGNALQLPYSNNAWDIVISGCCMLHLTDWRKALCEAVRVSKDIVIFHRHPILWDSPTKFFLKKAYGVPCIEIWFNINDFINACKEEGLELVVPIKRNTVFERNTDYGLYGHYSIVCRKV